MDRDRGRPPKVKMPTLPPGLTLNPIKTARGHKARHRQIRNEQEATFTPLIIFTLSLSSLGFGAS
jgi:hypothetical protein